MTRQFQFERTLLRKCTAVLFVVLMLGFGFVQAVHVHDAASPASHCSLCMVAHSAAAVTPASTTIAPLVAPGAFVAFAPQLCPHLQVGASFIRPPPQSL